MNTAAARYKLLREMLASLLQHNNVDFRNQILTTLTQRPGHFPIRPDRATARGRRTLPHLPIPGASTEAIYDLPAIPTLDVLPFDLLGDQDRRDVVARIHSLPADVYTLDVMFAKSRGLWTTWNFHKKPSTGYLRTVIIQVRLFDPVDDADLSFLDRRLDLGADDSRFSKTVEAFMGLIMMTLRYGPGWTMDSPTLGLDFYSIYRLVIDCKPTVDSGTHPSVLVDTRYLPGGQHHAAHHDGDLFPEHVHAHIAPEHRLGLFMARCFEHVLSFRVGGLCGQYLYAYVAEPIEVRVDGRITSKWSLDAMLHGDLAPHSGGGDQLADWKRRTWLRRRELEDLWDLYHDERRVDNGWY